MYKIAIILGSIRTGRQTPKAVHYLAKVLRNDTMVEKVDVLDLVEYNFPLMEKSYSYDENPPEGAAQFSQVLHDADAIVFASPEYHGNTTGAFKNAIDYFTSEFKRKPIGVLTTSTGGLGGIHASVQMQLQVLALSAYPMPYKLLVGNINTAFDENGDAIEEKLIANTEKFTEELLWLTAALVNCKVNNI